MEKFGTSSRSIFTHEPARSQLRVRTKDGSEPMPLRQQLEIVYGRVREIVNATHLCALKRENTFDYHIYSNHIYSTKYHLYRHFSPEIVRLCCEQYGVFFDAYFDVKQFTHRFGRLV